MTHAEAEEFADEIRATIKDEVRVQLAAIVKDAAEGHERIEKLEARLARLEGGLNVTITPGPRKLKRLLVTSRDGEGRIAEISEVE